MPRASGSRRRGRSLQQLAAPKKAPVDREPIWFTFPALTPAAYRKPRRLSPTELDRLNRLAEPKPEPCEPGLPPAARNEEGRPFRPQLTAPWPTARHWKLRMFEHLQVDKEEADSWFKIKVTTRVTAKKKEQDDEITSQPIDVMFKLDSCGHLEVLESNYKICCLCKKKVCRKCWLKACPGQIDSFAHMDEDEQIRTLQDQLDVEDWEARVLLRNAVPVVERLSVKSPRKVRVIKEEPEEALDEAPKEREKKKREKLIEKVDEDGGESGAEDFEEVASDGESYSIRTAEQTARAKSPDRSDAFQRLTTPRKDPVFKKIPYLPWMKSALPHMADVCSVEGGYFDPDELAHQVDSLESQGKIERWQARTLLRCAVPVFERLTGAGRAGRASALSTRSRSSQAYR
mmetsp:Transcript_120598/g.257553  ORF Transcript_120598/g.257553 Transcript_120598/m.257553 type:complete len:402 (+) Transcript_120598:150-1355(+)